MRIDVEKFLVIGPESERDQVFTEAQRMGIIEFIRKKPTSLESPPEIQNFIDALHVLRQMIPVKQEPTLDLHSAPVLARHIVERAQELERLREMVRVLEKERDRIEIFGDFSLSEMKELEHQSHRIIQFFFAKRVENKPSPNFPELIEIGHAHSLNYYIAINKEAKNYDGLIEIRIERSLGDLRQEIAQINRQIDIYETELATLTHKKNVLKYGLINTLNHYNLEDSKGRIEPLLDGDAFAVEVWVPKNKIQSLYQLAETYHLYITSIAVEKNDRVPTHLENRRAARLGEDLIGIYDIPSTQDRDPSLWVFIAFGIFFSMIIADAGYGLVLFLISLWLYFKYGRKSRGLIRRFTLLSISLSIGCMIWGTLLLSFFGIELAPESKIRNYSIVNIMVVQKAEYFIHQQPKSYQELISEYPQLKGKTTAEGLLKGVVREQQGMGKYTIYNNFQGNALLELAIFIGTIHILLSFLRYVDKNWSGLGWAIFMVGAYLYFPSILGAVSLIHYIFHVPYELGTLIGKYLVYGGLSLAVILAIIQKRLGGLAEIMHVVQVFADVMSYLRIYALSLAGMIMASTFNNIAMKMPFYIGIIIILAGHTLNFTLALMGGVIHGLRLNFIEWYHYSFEGGGKRFNPLTLLKYEP